jgi:hypothetical protein
MAQNSRTRSMFEMAEENERLWSKLEDLYDALGDIFEDDEEDEEDDS